MKPVLQVPSASAEPPPEPEIERRTQPDRRQRPTSVWGSFPPAGYRMQSRRGQEHRRPYFVDRFSATAFVLVLMILIASTVDAVLTIELIAAGGSEINPVMDRLLDCGVVPFVLGKYLLTAVGLPVLLIYKNQYLFGTRLRVGYLLPVVVALYGILIAYQGVLMYFCAGW